jgi:leishmanolysin
LFQILLILVFFNIVQAKNDDKHLQWRGQETGSDKHVASHSCIHDEIIEQRRKKPGNKVYSVTPQVYHGTVDTSEPIHRKGRSLLGISEVSSVPKNTKQPIRIYLNYDAVGHSPARDCRNIGDIVKVSLVKQIS